MKTILYCGCHCDDVEIGCGGTIAKRAASKEYTQIAYNFSHVSPQGVDLRNQSTAALSYLGIDTIVFGDLPVRSFSQCRQELWEECNRLELAWKPDLVITQCDDGHQDHKALFEEVCRRTFKKNILSYSIAYPYQVPSYNVGRDDYFVRLNQKEVNDKLKALKNYEIYRDKSYFQEDMLLATMRIAGNKSGGGFAEAFKVWRLIEE